LSLNSGDQVELWVGLISSGNALNTDTFSPANTTYLSMALLTPLSGTAGPVTAARAYRTAAYTVTSQTWQTIPLDTKAYDPGNNFSTATGRYTVPATGTYLCTGTVMFAPGTTGAIAGLSVNGGLPSVRGGAAPNVAAPLAIESPTVTDVVSCNAGDTISLACFPGGADALYTGVAATYLSVVQVGNSMNFTAAGGDLKGTYPNPLVAPATVTSLPSSPIDGQQIYYVADATNGVVWHLRYRAASGSTHKWEFVGGGKIVLGPQGSLQLTTASTWTAVTGGPTLTIPLPGDYRIAFGVNSQNIGTYAAAYNTNAGLGKNGANVGTAGLFVPTAQFSGAEIMKTSRLNDLVAGDVISTMAFSASAVRTDFTNGWLDIEPIRIG
jgi:hypothetical protein